ICLLIATGATYAEVAAELGLAVSTVENNFAVAMEKLFLVEGLRKPHQLESWVADAVIYRMVMEREGRAPYRLRQGPKPRARRKKGRRGSSQTSSASARQLATRRTTLRSRPCLE